jgi:3-deoxy-D-manno-octulosonate 8-phosphate phosphatase KdsC-like HAD superfamily phosphatase
LVALAGLRIDQHRHVAAFIAGFASRHARIVTRRPRTLHFELTYIGVDKMDAFMKERTKAYMETAKRLKLIK